jgi:hypothetical protein
MGTSSQSGLSFSLSVEIFERLQTHSFLSDVLLLLLLFPFYEITHEHQNKIIWWIAVLFFLFFKKSAVRKIFPNFLIWTEFKRCKKIFCCC